MKTPRMASILVALLLTGILLIAYSRAHSGDKTAPPHSATLTWTPSDGATSYNVYRSTISGGPYTKIGIALSPTYIDTPLPSKAVFYYVVTAVRGGQESGFSKEIKASTP